MQLIDTEEIAGQLFGVWRAFGGSRAPQATWHAVPGGAWRRCRSGIGICVRLREGRMETQRNAMASDIHD